MSLIMHCEPCGKSFTGPSSYGQHIESFKHKRKISGLNILNNSNAKKVLSDPAKTLSTNSLEHSRHLLECSTCCLKFNSFEEVQTHFISKEHATKIEGNAQTNVENSNNMTSLLIGSSALSNNAESNSNEISEKEDTILPEGYFKSQVSSYSFCNICQKCFSGPEPYKQHMESAGHIKKAELKEKISLGIIVTTPELSCAPCNKTFSGIVPYNQHLSSDTHRKKIESLQLLKKIEVDSGSKVNMTGLELSSLNKDNNPWFCKICDIICSGPAPFAQHNSGMAHLKNLCKAQRDEGTNDVQCSSLQINGFNISKKDIILPGLMDNKEDAYNVKLRESVTVFLPEEEINFELNNKTNLKSEPEEIDSGELNKTNLELRDKSSDDSDSTQVTLNGISLTMQYKEGIPESRIEEKCDIYQICKFCEVKLYDKDEAMNHFESLEHFQKRWR